LTSAIFLPLPETKHQGADHPEHAKRLDKIETEDECDHPVGLLEGDMGSGLADPGRQQDYRRNVEDPPAGPGGHQPQDNRPVHRQVLKAVGVGAHGPSVPVAAVGLVGLKSTDRRPASQYSAPAVNADGSEQYYQSPEGEPQQDPEGYRQRAFLS